MSEKTINWMKKPELITLILQTINDINTIRSSKQWAINSLGIIKSKELEINGSDEDWVEWLVQKVNQWYEEIDKKIKLIEEAYNEILTDGEEEWEESLKTQIETLLETINQDKIDIKKFRNEIFWYKKEGTEEIIPWLKSKLNTLYEEQERKYNDFYQQIESELKAWATSVNLAKTFEKKVWEYKEQDEKRANYFMYILLIWILYYSLSITLSDKSQSITEVLIYLLHNLPLIASISWLAIFISNRRSEAKKLEESYTHKEVMARSFMWYRKSVEELNTDDNELLEKHMNNLLTAIGKDSSEFLINQSESHPLLDFAKDLLKKWKIPSSIDDILGTYSGKIELKKE